MQAAQTPEETQAFVEAFARVNVRMIRDVLGAPAIDAMVAESPFELDWDDPDKLHLSGLTTEQIDHLARAGGRFLHIDVALSPKGRRARVLFLNLAGLSDKQQKALFPLLRSAAPTDADRVSAELIRLNAWLSEGHQSGFDPVQFVSYQRGIGIHGRSQNLSGAIGAAGAAIAFVDAITELAPGSIVDTVGVLPPQGVRSPLDLYCWLAHWREAEFGRYGPCRGRAIVFASSKDANIFQPLGGPFADAKDALVRFTRVAKDEKARKQHLHEFAVGEVKTATDPANLHERMGLASRETQTELRTDRFLMMAVLNQSILAGGTQQRVMNNKDLTRFSHVFNLHHCWGWDGGRDRNPAHWQFFKDSVAEWCGL
jgi:hypothetical protein